MSYYPEYWAPPGQQLRPLTGEQRAIAWAEYEAARKRSYYRPPLSGSIHLLWFFVGLFTFGLGWIGWLIHVCVGGTPALKPGARVPVWPPPGYYIPDSRQPQIQ